jgi:hypothetical protein
MPAFITSNPVNSRRSWPTPSAGMPRLTERAVSPARIIQRRGRRNSYMVEGSLPSNANA